MADRRIGIPGGHGDFVRELLSEGGGRGPFRHMVDVLAFAAAVGAKRKRWREASKRSDGDPIRLEVFEGQNYVPLINLLAVTRRGNVEILSDNDGMEEERARIFEGYVNGGLDFLKTELRGSPDYLEAIVGMLNREMKMEPESTGGFDLRDLTRSG